MATVKNKIKLEHVCTLTFNFGKARKQTTSKKQKMDCHSTAVCGNTCTGQVIDMRAENSIISEGELADHRIHRIQSDSAALIAPSQLEESSATILHFSIGLPVHQLTPWPAPSRYVTKGRKLFCKKNDT
jgi:hypothetical protein